jgi:hypothetical protein
LDLLDRPNGAPESVDLLGVNASADANRTVDELAKTIAGILAETAAGGVGRELSVAGPVGGGQAVAAEGVDPASVITSLADAARHRLGVRNEHKHRDLSISEHAHHGLSPGGRRSRSRRSSGGRHVRISQHCAGRRSAAPRQTTAMQTWNENAQKMIAGGASEQSPGPSAKQIMDNVFDFAEQLLASQREFAKRVLAAGTKATDAATAQAREATAAMTNHA